MWLPQTVKARGAKPWSSQPHRPEQMTLNRRADGHKVSCGSLHCYRSNCRLQLKPRRVLWGFWEQNFSFVSQFLDYRKQASFSLCYVPSSHGQVQTAADQGRERMQRLGRSSQKTIVQPGGSPPVGCSVTQPRPALCSLMGCSTPGFPGLHCLPEFAQIHVHWVGCCSVAQSCPILWDPMDCSTPGFPVLHHLPELAQTPVLDLEMLPPPPCL